MEGLRVSNADLVVYVHPSKSNNVSEAIRRELSTLLFQYTENFDGALLAYDVYKPDKIAKILPGLQPYFGVKLKTKLLLFSPKPNMLLEGQVVKLTQESIHVVILGFSSATIVEEDIRDEFRYKTKHGEGVYASRLHKRHVIMSGAIIRFMVKSVDEDILHMSGSLIPAHTGSICWLDKHSEDVSLSNSSKKRKESEGALDVQDLHAVDGGALRTNNEHQLKKSKKRKSGEEF